MSRTGICLAMACVVSALCVLGQNTVTFPPCTPQQGENDVHVYTSPDAKLIALVARVAGDASWNYYAVKLCMIRTSNVGDYLACDMAASTQDPGSCELLGYLPETGIEVTTIAVDVLSQKIEIKTDLGSPGAWMATPTRYAKQGWNYEQITWELAFERSFCWDALTMAAVWKVPARCVAFIEVFVDYMSASGGCAAKRTDQGLVHFLVRAPLDSGGGPSG